MVLLGAPSVLVKHWLGLCGLMVALHRLRVHILPCVCTMRVGAQLSFREACHKC